MWLLCGYYVVTMVTILTSELEEVVEVLEGSVVTMWLLCGYYVVTILTSELEEVVEVLEGSVYSLSGSLLNDTFECSFFNILSFDMPQRGACITWYCLA